MNNHEELEEEKCLGCSLVDEFKELIDDNVNWEEALRYVLHVALDIKDDIIADIVDENYTLGFGDGLTMGVEKAANLINEMVEYTKEEIIAYHDERNKDENETVEESEEIEDISDEDFDKIAKLIRESKGYS